MWQSPLPLIKGHAMFCHGVEFKKKEQYIPASLNSQNGNCFSPHPSQYCWSSIKKIRGL